MHTMQDDKSYIANTYSRFNLLAIKGKGAECEDIDGKKYIDFSSGIGVNVLGFCDSGWQQAIAEQAATLNHISNLYYTAPCVKLAKKLCEKSGLKKVFFANSGAEANEGAIKTARKYSADKYTPERYEIITLVNSFHGRTITTLAATGQEVFHQKFTPLTEGFVYAQIDIDDVKSKMSDKTCAVMLELIQGEGGVNVLDKYFVHSLIEECAKRDILVIVDEVQTGIGRTGKMFCFEHYDFKPDIITLAKGLGGGLPIGAVLFGEKTENVLGAGDHGSTFGGNPIASAGAIEILNRLTDDFLMEVEKKGQYIREKLSGVKGINSIDGKGLMLGLDVSASSAQIVKAALKEGVILLTAKQKVRILAPLNITYEELDKGIERMKKVFEVMN